MSVEDRQRWNRRYRDGAYAGRDHPAAWLLHSLGRIGADAGRPPLTILDLACGAGRNALHLAELGHEVHAVDIAGEALERGRRKAGERQLSIQWREHDLDRGLPEGLPHADLILMIRYLDPGLISACTHQLKAGGRLLVEVHMRTDREVAGPRNPDFRVAPGALCRAAGEAGLAIEEYREVHTKDPDGEPVALARLLARLIEETPEDTMTRVRDSLTPD